LQVSFQNALNMRVARAYKNRLRVGLRSSRPGDEAYDAPQTLWTSSASILADSYSVP